MTTVLPDQDIDLALDDPAAEFDCVVAFAEALTPDRADHYQKIYNRHWDSGVNRAGSRAYKQLQRAGRLTVDVDDALDSLCGIVGGATDVALAVLARDLIPAEDYERLTRWWRSAGLPLAGPAPIRYIRPAQPAVRASWACGGAAVLLASSGFYAVDQGWLTFQSRYLPLLVAVLFLLGFGALALRHAADQIDRNDTPADQEV
ncbi:hypothetical protein AB0J14_38320 [Micromonospora arborensis]|uniref:hypothetical protein n=1 Tax=Micromonospora arborensis TaxID=2116518 RepID=UPI0034113948